MTFTLEKIFFILASLGLGLGVLVLAKPVLTPLVFAVLLALALSPLCSKLERRGMNRLFAIITTYLIITLSIALVITTLSITFANIYQELPEIRGKIESGLLNLQHKVAEWAQVSDEHFASRIRDNQSEWLSPFWQFLESSLSSSVVALGNIFLTGLYTFLLLYYRRGIRRVLFRRLSDRQQDDRKELLQEVQDVIKGYFSSFLVVMLVLSIINSVGLWIIGIDYPIFWGFLAGLLVIIPYIGTTLGGIFPFLYALATTDTVWQPVAIAVMYYAVQQIEGNFITPKIVGSKVQVNAFTVIFTMILGAFIWGLPGIVLALPLVAVLRTVLVRYESSRSIGLLMSTSVTE